MNILEIFPKSRDKLIQSLKFSYFLFEAYNHLRIKYLRSKNPLIKSSLRILDWCWSQQYNQIKDYKQLLTDYPFWESRHYSLERMRKFVEYELSTMDFLTEVLYPSLSNTNEARDLKEDFRRQKNIELDPKSFGFSKIILGLVFLLERFDEDLEESFFTEEEFREIIQNSLMKAERYFISESQFYLMGFRPFVVRTGGKVQFLLDRESLFEFQFNPTESNEAFNSNTVVGYYCFYYSYCSFYKTIYQILSEIVEKDL